MINYITIEKFSKFQYKGNRFLVILSCSHYTDPSAPAGSYNGLLIVTEHLIPKGWLFLDIIWTDSTSPTNNANISPHVFHRQLMTNGDKISPQGTIDTFGDFAYAVECDTLQEAAMFL